MTQRKAQKIQNGLTGHGRGERGSVRTARHDAAKLLPNHSRHVLVWTNRGEYRAWYDHKWKCWRTRREGLKITHWREKCGPEDWPVAK